MKNFFLTLAMIFTTCMFSKGRNVSIKREIKYASLVKEVVIERYVSGKYVSWFSCVNKIDKIFARELGNDKIHEIEPFEDGTCLSCYRTIDSLKRGGEDYNGYWPDINDTVLIVVNDKNELSLFASKQKNLYSFWSPYSTSSIATSFEIALPFKSYKPSEKKATINRVYISQKDFWSFYKSSRSNNTLIFIKIKQGDRPIIPIVIYNDSSDLNILKAQVKDPLILQKSKFIKEDSVNMSIVDRLIFEYRSQDDLFRRINFNPISGIEAVKFFRTEKILELKIPDASASYYYLNALIKNTESNKILNDILVEYLPVRFQSN